MFAILFFAENMRLIKPHAVHLDSLFLALQLHVLHIFKTCRQGTRAFGRLSWMWAHSWLGCNMLLSKNLLFHLKAKRDFLTKYLHYIRIRSQIVSKNLSRALFLLHIKHVLIYFWLLWSESLYRNRKLYQCIILSFSICRPAKPEYYFLNFEATKVCLTFKVMPEIHFTLHHNFCIGHTDLLGGIFVFQYQRLSPSKFIVFSYQSCPFRQLVGSWSRRIQTSFFGWKSLSSLFTGAVYDVPVLFEMFMHQ